MEVFVKRSTYRTFEKAKIEIDKSEELSALQLACLWTAEETQKSIQKFKAWNDEEALKMIESLQKRYEEYMRLYEQMEIKNEIEWNGK